MTKLIFAGVFLATGLVRADELPPAKSRVSITKEFGKPMTAVWASGNRAEVMLSRNASIDVPTEYQVTETSCSDNAGQKFTIHFALKADVLKLVWTQHKDPEKVGKPVTIGGIQNIALSETEVITNSSQFNSPDLVTDLVKDKIQFGDVSWIPGLENGKPKEFSIDTWFEENMVVNSQTGISENRIVGTVSGVHVTADGTIDSMESGQEVGGNFGGALLLVGDVVTWIMTTPQGVCQISMKPDLGPPNIIVGKYFASLNGKSEPYVWGSDSHSKIADEDRNSLLQTKFLEFVDE